MKKFFYNFGQVEVKKFQWQNRVGGCDIDVIVQKEQKQSVVACRGVVFFAKLFAQVFHSNSSTPKYTLGLQQYVVALTQNQLHTSNLSFFLHGQNF